MKVVIRDYFIRFYDLFEELASFKGENILTFQKIKSEIELLINKSIKYNLLEIENINQEIYDSEVLSGLQKNRIDLLSVLYNNTSFKTWLFI